MHQCTTLGGMPSGGCPALRRARAPASIVEEVVLEELETQQQSGPVPGGGQQDVQNVIHVQSGPFPFIPQVE